MAGGFGFIPPQAPRPTGQQVGEALMSRPAASVPGVPVVDPLAEGKALRQAGATKMGAAGQVDDHPMEDGMGHSPNAVNIAVGEALTRMGGGAAVSKSAHRDVVGHVRQLMQLGLSATEAELLVQTGGV